MFFQHVRHMKNKHHEADRPIIGKLAASRIALEKLVLTTCADLNFQTNEWKIFRYSMRSMVHPLFFVLGWGTKTKTDDL